MTLGKVSFPPTYSLPRKTLGILPLIVPISSCFYELWWDLREEENIHSFAFSDPPRPKSIQGSAISSDVRVDKVPECGRGLGEQQTEKILHKIVELEWVPEIECLDSESSFFPHWVFCLHNNLEVNNPFMNTYIDTNLNFQSPDNIPPTLKCHAADVQASENLACGFMTFSNNSVS